MFPPLPPPSVADPLTAAVNCRLCPRDCQQVARADGSCPVCICNGVALTDCGPAPAECSEGCQVERGIDGCLRCSCRHRDASLCPPVDACPEECQQLIGGSGCLECVCELPDPVCPPIQCPDDCRMVEQESGCPSCRCDPPGICPPIPECIRGCLDRDQENQCFFCNCTAPPSQPPAGRPDPPTFIVFPTDEPRPSTSIVVNEPTSPERQPSIGGTVLSVGSRRHPFDRKNVAAQCPKRPFTCPEGCRIGITPHGCRECYCGANALMCPFVEPCPSLCHVIDTGNGCCRCQCLRRPVVPKPRPWKIFRSPIPPPPSFHGPPEPWRDSIPPFGVPRP